MTEDCLFCKIVSGEEAANVVWADTDYLSIMDKFPINKGHQLVLPKVHYNFLTDMRDNEVAELFGRVSMLAKVTMKALSPDGLAIGQNNGAAANQQIFHVHVHIIPRFEGDVGDGSWPRRKTMTDGELNRTAENIRREIRNS